MDTVSKLQTLLDGPLPTPEEVAPKAPTTGVKFDAGKAPISLIPTSAMLAEAQVLGFGAAKYGKHNWRGGMDYTRLIDAAFRHLLAFSDGEDIDPESGLPHLAHLRCCAAFLIEFRAKGLGTDDRPQETK